MSSADCESSEDYGGVIRVICKEVERVLPRVLVVDRLSISELNMGITKKLSLFRIHDCILQEQ